MLEQSNVGDSSQALGRCNALTQLNLVSKRISIKQIIITTDETPFLSEQLKGRKVWRVEYEDCILKLKSALPNYPDEYPSRRAFSALLDVKTGNILKVTCQFAGERGQMRPEPDAKWAEEKLRGIQEIYTGFPEADPKLSFLEAIDAVQSGGVGCPHLAKEIDGLYVMVSRMGSKPKPVWIITLRGIPLLPSHGPALSGKYEPPEWMRNHIRNVFDATTGQGMYATTVPHPVY